MKQIRVLARLSIESTSTTWPMMKPATNSQKILDSTSVNRHRNRSSRRRSRCSVHRNQAKRQVRRRTNSHLHDLSSPLFSRQTHCSTDRLRAYFVGKFRFLSHGERWHRSSPALGRCYSIRAGETKAHSSWQGDASDASHGQRYLPGNCCALSRSDSHRPEMPNARVNESELSLKHEHHLPFDAVSFSTDFL